MPKPTTLAFDTSGPYVTAALLRNGDIAAAEYEDMARGQAEHLFPMIETVLNGARTSFKDLDAIGVGIGPGNFTGIRIAVSAARGLAISLGKPAIGVSLMEALALNAPCPALFTLNAPKDTFYVQHRTNETDGDIYQTSLKDLPEFAPDTVVIGQDSKAVAKHLNLENRPAAYAPASAIARIAAMTCTETNVDRPTPLYIRPADAAPSKTPPIAILS